MKFIKLFCYDVKRGFLGTWKKYCGVVGMTFLFFVFFNLLYSAYGRWQAITGLPTVRATYGDAVFYIFAGMQKYIPDPTSPFLFPMIWLLLYIVLAWITLEYAANDLAAYGQQILIHRRPHEMVAVQMHLEHYYRCRIFLHHLAFPPDFLPCGGVPDYSYAPRKLSDEYFRYAGNGKRQCNHSASGNICGNSACADRAESFANDPDAVYETHPEFLRHCGNSRPVGLLADAVFNWELCHADAQHRVSGGRHEISGRDSFRSGAGGSGCRSRRPPFPALRHSGNRIGG